MLVAVFLFLPQRADSQQASRLGSSESPAAMDTSEPVARVSTLSSMDRSAVISAPAEFNAAVESASLPAFDPAATNGAGQVKEVYLDRPDTMKQEIIIEGMISYGNYKIFASGYDDKLYTGGVEYDRHSWGRFLGGEMDYVAEILPFVLLNKPLSTNQYGSPRPISEKNIREYVPGLGISPIGFRLQWRSVKRVRPYLEAKGGVIVFTKKVPATQASYESFSLQSATGLQVMLNQKWGLRLGLFSDFHFSNAFVVPDNPGLDVMNANLGLSYHF